MRGCLIVALLPVFILLGIIVPKLIIPDVQVETDASSEHMPKYALVRAGQAAGAIQHLLRVETSVVEIRPDPAGADGCDWGYREPITGTAILRTYTLWGIPLETIEITCNSEQVDFDPWP